MYWILEFPLTSSHCSRNIREKSMFSFCNRAPMSGGTASPLCTIFSTHCIAKLSLEIQWYSKGPKTKWDKAAGPDGWRPCEWLLLPNQFFTCLAALWQACLLVQQVPQDWLHIRCVLVPKPEGGLRPISVACLAWRIGMTSILQQLQPWLDSWLPPFLLGGLKHRDAREAHELLHHDIFQALQTHRKFFGAKLNIRKCFDSVSPLQAIHVWDHLQAPTEVTGLLRFFYSFSARRFESQKVCAATEFTCSTSILQGCPASPALLAGLMSVWGFHVLRRDAVSISGYIDDRTVWALGNNGQQRVVDAWVCTQQIDLTMGFSFHADKCELFATGKPSCTILKAAAVNSSFHWPVVGSFKLLGVQYNLSRRKFTPLADRLRNHVLQRLARIRITRLPFRTKNRAIRALVLSLFSHTGAWYGLSKKNLQRWRVCIERAMMTPVKSRSRLLLWACHFGAHLDPEFVMDFSVIRHELWKLSPSAQALRTRVSSSPRLREVLSKQVAVATSCSSGVCYSFWRVESCLGRLGYNSSFCNFGLGKIPLVIGTETQKHGLVFISEQVSGFGYTQNLACCSCFSSPLSAYCIRGCHGWAYFIWSVGYWSGLSVWLSFTFSTTSGVALPFAKFLWFWPAGKWQWTAVECVCSSVSLADGFTWFGPRFHYTCSTSSCLFVSLGGVWRFCHWEMESHMGFGLCLWHYIPRGCAGTGFMFLRCWGVHRMHRGQSLQLIGYSAWPFDWQHVRPSPLGKDSSAMFLFGTVAGAEGCTIAVPLGAVSWKTTTLASQQFGWKPV